MSNNSFLEALTVLYSRLDLADDDNVIASIENDCLTSHKGRSGRDILWYLDATQNVAIYVDSLTFLTDEELDNELL